MPDVHGFFAPRTATGKASLLRAYYWQVGVQWNGGQLLRDNLAARAESGQHA